MAIFSRFSASPLAPDDVAKRKRALQSMGGRGGEVAPMAGLARARAEARMNPSAAPGGVPEPQPLRPGDNVIDPALAQQGTRAPPPAVDTRPPSPTPPHYGDLGGVEPIKAAVATSGLSKRPGDIPTASSGAPPPPAPPTDPFDLGALQAQQAKERDATGQQFDVQAARAAADASNRGGLGGLGLSGATSALVADSGRASARAKALALMEQARGQRGELSQAVIDRANLQDLANQGQDLSSIGIKPGPGEAAANQADSLATNAGVDLTQIGGGFDDDKPAGSKEKPYGFSPEEYAQVAASAPGGLTLVPYKPPFSDTTFQVYTDKLGHWYYFGSKAGKASQ